MNPLARIDAGDLVNMIATEERLSFALSNGWTFSIAYDTPPAICSVAAWPSEDDGKVQPSLERRWYEWGGEVGRIDVRCHGAEDISAALTEIASAKPPAGAKVKLVRIDANLGYAIVGPVEKVFDTNARGEPVELPPTYWAQDADCLRLTYMPHGDVLAIYSEV